jgi:hypothetical protein
VVYQYFNQSRVDAAPASDSSIMLRFEVEASSKPVPRPLPPNIGRTLRCSIRRSYSALSKPDYRFTERAWKLPKPRSGHDAQYSHSHVRERRERFAHIFDSLCAQVPACDLNAEIKIIFLRDNNENSLGFKRNRLMRQARAVYRFR